MGDVLCWSFWEPTRESKENLQDNKAKIGIIFISLDNALIPYSFSFRRGYFNSTTKDEADIAGLELALQVPMANLSIYGYSELIAKQLNGEYNVKKAGLIPYHNRVERLLT